MSTFLELEKDTNWQSSFHIFNGSFYVQNFWLRSRPQYAGEIIKRSFHSKKASQIFYSHYTGEIGKPNDHQSFLICV